MPLTYYKAIPISDLKLSTRHQKLLHALLNAPHRYSTTNAEIAKHAYSLSKGKPYILRRAKALATAFDKMPIVLHPDELLAGNRSEDFGVMPRLPEHFTIIDNPRTIPNDARYEALELYDAYWSLLSEQAKRGQASLYTGYPAGSEAGFGHICADYGMIVREGALALAKKADLAYQKYQAEGLTRQRDFCQASAIACRAFVAWGERYGALAKEHAEKCRDPIRRTELLELADICERVPALPARNFKEALQAYLFAHIAMSVEQQGGSISLGEFDRLLYPYYKNDIESGAITPGQAAELIDGFYLKIMENAIWPREVVNFANMAVGGCDAEGFDASNDLTWMAIDSAIKTGSVHPMLSFRWHPTVDKDLWQRVMQLIGRGGGLPALFSDPEMISALKSFGFTAEEAADYGVVGCVEPALSGRLHGQTLGGHINLLICLELACNNGKLRMTEEQLGPETGYLRDFTSIDDILAAYIKQVHYAIELNHECVEAVAKVQKELYGYPLMSSLQHGMIEAGQDLTWGILCNRPSICITGLTNVVDSLLALIELTDNKKYSFADFDAALDNDFVGYSNLLADINNSSNRFGNGSAEFYKLYNDICAVHNDIITKQQGPRGGNFISGLWPTSWHVRQGQYTGASPDGRLAGTPIADSAGPISARAKKGPTAIAHDMSGIDNVTHWPGGYVFNMRFSKDLFAGESLDKLSAYIDSCFKMGIMQMQINVHSKELLLDAQKFPEKYPDLLVRVAGFSAYFVTLDPALQDEIISRSEITM